MLKRCILPVTLLWQDSLIEVILVPNFLEDWLKRFDRIGNVKFSKPNRTITVINHSVFGVMMEIIKYWTVSGRHLSNEGISRTSERKITKNNKFHLYRIHHHQKVPEADFNNLAEFCNGLIWLLNKLREDRKTFIFSLTYFYTRFFLLTTPSFTFHWDYFQVLPRKKSWR